MDVPKIQLNEMETSAFCSQPWLMVASVPFLTIYLLAKAGSLVYSMQLTHSQKEYAPEPLVLQVAAESHLLVHESARSAIASLTASG